MRSLLPTLPGQPQQQTHGYVVIGNENKDPHLSRACLIAQDGWKLVELDRAAGVFQLYRVSEDNEERNEVSETFRE